MHKPVTFTLVAAFAVLTYFAGYNVTDEGMPYILIASVIASLLLACLVTFVLKVDLFPRNREITFSLFILVGMFHPSIGQLLAYDDFAYKLAGLALTGFPILLTFLLLRQVRTAGRYRSREALIQSAP